MPTSAPVKKAPAQPFLVRSLVPLMTIAGTCLIGSGGLFALDGHLPVVWPAFLLVVAGPLIFPFILFPAGLMAGLWNAFHGKQKAIVRVFAVGSVAYLAAVMAVTLWLMAWLATSLPVSSMRFFVEMFVVSGAVTPWAVFALRDRENQLFILLLWAMTIAGTALLPLKMAGIVGAGGYAFAVWIGILLVMLVEHLRQSQIIAAREAAARKAAAAAAPAASNPEEPPAQ